MMSKVPSFCLDQPTVSEQSGIRYLHFDTPWIQGAMQVNQPHRLVLTYTEQMMAWLLFLAPVPVNALRHNDPLLASGRITQLGLGAGALTRYCLKYFANPLTVVEWNPKVTTVCQQFFKLPAKPHLEILHTDAGQWVQDKHTINSTQILMVDLYDAQARGPVRDSLAFYQGCFNALNPIGILVVNLFGAHDSYAHNVRHIHQAFNGRLLFLPQIEEGNQIVLAFKGPAIDIEWDDLYRRAQFIDQTYRLPALKWIKSMVSRRVHGRLVIN